MKIRVNGQERDVAPDFTLAALIDALELDRDGVAVAVDREVVPRGRHADHRLHEGAAVEIIRAVGGG